MALKRYILNYIAQAHKLHVAVWLQVVHPWTWLLNRLQGKFQFMLPRFHFSLYGIFQAVC